MDKNWVRERGRRARRRRCWWGGGRRTVARAGRVSVFLVLSCWWGPRHSPAEQRRGARDKGLICGGAHSYSHLYCQCVAVALIILVSLDYHIHVTFYLGNDGVMTRCIHKWTLLKSSSKLIGGDQPFIFVKFLLNRIPYIIEGAGFWLVRG